MNQGTSNKHKQQAQAAAGRAQPEVVFYFKKKLDNDSGIL